MVWYQEPFMRFVNSASEINQIHQLTVCGIRAFPIMPAIINIFNNVDVDLFCSSLGIEGEERHKVKAVMAGREKYPDAAAELLLSTAQFAQEEMGRQFHSVNSHALASLWSAVESLVNDLLHACLLNDTRLMKIKYIAKIKLPLMKFDHLGREGRMELLLQELKRTLSSDFRSGVGQFECVLKVFGLSGAVDSGLRRDLIEARHVRNVIAHRRGLADARFLEGCPWLKGKLAKGDRVHVGTEEFHRYSEAIQRYSVLLAERVKNRFGE